MFVYGTLLPGEPLWPALERYSASWERATVPGRLWDTGRGYPAARFELDDEAGVVPGVVVVIVPEVLGEALAVLDAIEEEGTLYRRVEVATSRGPAVGYEWLGPTAGFTVLVDGWRS